MAEELTQAERDLLSQIAGLHGMPEGAFNIRRDGELVERHSSANIEISTKTGEPGIDIRIAPGTKNETVFIPVIVTQAGLKDVVYTATCASSPGAASTTMDTLLPSTTAFTRSIAGRTAAWCTWRSTTAKAMAIAS